MNALGLRWRAAGWILLRWGLAGVFLYAGIMKLRDAVPFAASIARFQIVPEFLIHLLALGLPPLEILCAVALCVGPWKRQAALGIVMLCAIFLIALVSAVARGIAVECSCFGAAGAELLWKVIARDVLLVAAASATYIHLGRRSLPCREGISTNARVLNKPSSCLH